MGLDLDRNTAFSKASRALAYCIVNGSNPHRAPVISMQQAVYRTHGLVCVCMCASVQGICSARVSSLENIVNMFCVVFSVYLTLLSLLLLLFLLICLSSSETVCMSGSGPS